jgi:hypothetical protein
MGASTVALAAPIVGNVVGGLIGGSGASQAGQTAAQGAQQGQATLQANLQNLTPNYQPYQNLGAQGVSNISSMLPYFTNQFSNADLNAQLAPNYAFQLGQGQQATAQMQNAAGGAMSGNAAKALQDYTQNYAGNAYQQAFNNYQAQRGNIYNNLSSIANIGQNAVAGLGNLATGTAQGVASLQTGAANAQAAGQVGAANAYSGAAQNIGNLGLLSNVLSGSSAPLDATAIGSGATSGGSFLGDAFALA